MQNYIGIFNYRSYFCIITFAIISLLPQIQVIGVPISPTWSADPGFQVSSNQIITNTNLFNTSTSTYSMTYTAFGTGQNAKLIWSINIFELSQGVASFGIKIIESSISTSGFQFNATILNLTVIYSMKIDIASFDATIADIQYMYYQLNCQFLNQGTGNRSENVSFTLPSRYNGEIHTIAGQVYPNAFMIYNPNGTYFNFDWYFSYNRTHYTITFKTSQLNTITIIWFAVLVVDTDYSQGNRYLRSFYIGESVCQGLPGDTCLGTGHLVLPAWATPSLQSHLIGLTKFIISKNDKVQWTFDSFPPLNFQVAFVKSTSILTAKMSVFYVAKISCPLSYLNPGDLMCYTVCPTSYNSTADSLCLSCHYTCNNSCNSYGSNNCLGCNSSLNRNPVAGSPFSCPCNSGYIDIGVELCKQCSNYIPGCLVCSSFTTCTTCMAGLTKNAAGVCKCTNTALTVTKYGICINLVACINYYTAPNGTLVCMQCNSTSNFILTNYSCSCPAGYTLGYLADGVTPNCNVDPEVCGNGIRTISQACDDGNTVPGDGCDATCSIEHEFSCFGDLRWLSFCIDKQTKISYLGAMKIQTQQIGQLYFKIQPYNSKIQNSLLLTPLLSTSVTSVPTFSSFSYIPYTRSLKTEVYVKLRFSYSENVNSKITHDMTLTAQDSSNKFSVSTSFNITGTNLPLTTSEGHIGYQILNYIVLSLSILAFLILIASIFTENWIGIQLIHFFQFCFFYVFLINDIDYQIYQFLGYLKYSNGYNDLYNDINLFQYEKFNSKLYIMRYRAEILTNFNFMAFLFLIPMILLFIKLLYPCIINNQKKKKNIKKLRNEQDQTDLQKKNQQPWLLSTWFIVGKIFVTITLAFSNEIIFNVFIEENHFIGDSLYFPNPLSQILELTLMMFIISVIGLLIFSIQTAAYQQDLNALDQFETNQEELKQHQEQDNNMTLNIIKFTRFSPGYPLAYTIFQCMKIVIISVEYSAFFVDQLFLSLEIIYLIGFLIVRPYKIQKPWQIKEDYCYTLHNLHNIWNSVSLIVVLTIILIHNQDEYSKNPALQYVLGYAVVVTCFISILFACLRLFGSRKIAEIIRNIQAKQQNAQFSPQNLQITSKPLKAQKPEKRKIKKSNLEETKQKSEKSEKKKRQVLRN